MRIAEFTASVVRALALTDSAFHLELFRTPGDELVFLEIGNRFGGAGVPAQHRICYGVDLAREAVLACTGEPSELDGPAVMLDRPEVGASGWLFIPLGETRRCRVTEVHGLGDLPGSVVWASTPAVGDVLNAASDVWNTAGRFIVGGESAASVERDLASIAETYSIGVRRGD
jgi:hypothetical protein